MSGLLLVLFGLCIGLSMLLSGMEAGVFTLSRLRIRHLMRGGDPRARALHGYLERPENFLWTILVGNTLSNLGVVSIGVMWLHRALGAWPWLMFIALAVGILIFYATCELLPKMLFRHHPNRLCMAMARPFRVVHFALRPLVALVELLSRWLLRWTGGRRFTGHLFGNRDELRRVMQEKAQGLTSEERTMINSVLDSQNYIVAEITTPLQQAVTVTTETPMSEVLTIARERGFDRFPVLQGEGRHRRIAGLLNLRSLLYSGTLDETKLAGAFIKTPLYLGEEMRLEVALREMQRTGHRVAIVRAVDGSEMGIVGLQDILKVIFGEVRL